MGALDPRWLSVELEAVENDEAGWGAVLNDSYDIAVQRVFEYQAKYRSDLIDNAREAQL